MSHERSEVPSPYGDKHLPVVASHGGLLEFITKKLPFGTSVRGAAKPANETTGETSLPRQVRILAIDGGGIRGIVPARLAEELEARIGRPLNETFHVISGVSTGAIVATGLASGLSAKQVVELYTTEGPKIFKKNFWDTVRTGHGLLKNIYSPVALETILANAFTNKKLSDIKACELHVMATDVTQEDSGRFEPFEFATWRAHGYRLRTGETGADNDYYLRDLVRATASAPIYFPNAAIKPVGAGDEKIRRFIDGALSQTDPTESTVERVRRLFPDAEEIVIVSLGTGYHSTSFNKNLGSGGLLAWARSFMPLISSVRRHKNGQRFDEEVYVRIDVDYNNASKDSLIASGSLDDASPKNMQNLKLAADRMIIENAAQIDALVKTLTPPRDSHTKLGFPGKGTVPPVPPTPGRPGGSSGAPLTPAP